MQKTKKIPTESELLQRFSQRCSLCEYSPYDILQKAQQTGVSREAAQRIVDTLIDNNFLNEERFVRAFIHDKFELAHWGRNKISAALRQKRIPSKLIDTELEEINSQDYLTVLQAILSAKNKQIKATTPYERSRKLAAFAASRGFEPHLIFDALDAMDLSATQS